MTNKTKSVEPKVADLANGWLKSYGLDYKLEQEPLNSEIDTALNDYFSKSGGKGGNRPDVKLLLDNQSRPDERWPILIEYKGHKNALVKLDKNGNVANTKTDNTPHYSNIKKYAVNGAVHYANALLHHTSYTDVIAIGMTGSLDETGNLEYAIEVWYVSKSNLGLGQKVGEFTDFSFLKPDHFADFIEKVKRLQLSQEDLDELRALREREIDASLTKLNNDIYQSEKGLSESDRVHLVAGTIMATLGVPGKIAPLEKSDLKSSTELGNTDGEIIMRKIEAFLREKKLPESKRGLIVRTLKNTIESEHINRVENGETRLKRVFGKIVDDLGIYYKIGLSTDFTGKLFNEMYNWLGFSQDKLNDVVLTPSYVATLLVRLARVNMDSYVWDAATGSAGLLVAAMNEMLSDARERMKSPQALAEKEAKIKAKQLLGLEILPSVYMLAVLNMILMGDGSSNILNEDSLRYLDSKDPDFFSADAFVLNPPYSAPGCGMVFVEKALKRMKSGYAAIIIQSSAGSGKAVKYNRRILTHSTLIASIKMPSDLFLGKSSVQTYIYVFRVGEPHAAEEVVKFIDFPNDGYKRSNRKKARNNLVNVDRATERYDELARLVRFGRSKLDILSDTEYYEGTIDPKNGADWNQSAPQDITPTLEDFKKNVAEYLAWEVSNLLRLQDSKDDAVGKRHPR
jgi:type I restriction-modification system DNA methylase subunit